MPVCPWEQYRKMYEAAQVSARIGSGLVKGSTEVTTEQVVAQMIDKDGGVREGSDPPEIWIYCQNCSALIAMLDTGRFEIERECGEGKKFETVAELMRSTT